MKGDTRLQAHNILQKIEELEFVFMLHVWTCVLGYHKVNKAMQKSDLLLSTCASSLQDCLSKITYFDELEHQAKATLPNVNYRTHKEKNSKETARK